MPATGVTNVPIFANLFLGWGLRYCIVLDDDRAGRTVYNQLKKDLYFDDLEKAKKEMYKIPNCIGIEDLFTKTDLKQHILQDLEAKVGDSNSEFMKGMSKGIFALKFWLKVKQKKIKIADLNKSSQDSITSLVKAIERMLAR